MGDGFAGALVFAACAEDDAVVGVFDDGAFFAVFFFPSERAECAVVYAFSAADAFFIVYCWIPRYLASMNTMICFFRHSFFTIFIGEWFML